MNYTAKRDMVIGRRIAEHGNKPIVQGERGNGATKADNLVRIAEWRNRYMSIPVEETIQPLRKVAR